MADMGQILQASTPPAPGEVLKQELLGDGELTQRQLAQALGISEPRLTMVLKGRCQVSAEIALRVERAFGISPTYWMQVRHEYELFHERQRLTAILDELPPIENRNVHAARPWFTQKPIAGWSQSDRRARTSFREFLCVKSSL